MRFVTSDTSKATVLQECGELAEELAQETVSREVHLPHNQVAEELLAPYTSL
mgnify:CR=1 FL=1